MRSERMFRWLLDMNMVEDSFDYSTFSLNREGLLKHDHQARSLPESCAIREIGRPGGDPLQALRAAARRNLRAGAGMRWRRRGCPGAGSMCSGQRIGAKRALGV